MAVRYYDDVLVAKLKRWTPSTSKIRVLRPSETKRLFELNADDTNDKPFALPCVALSRNNDIELGINVKAPRSYAGIKLKQTSNETMILNAIPIKVQYQLDIYTKTEEEGDEYIRQYLFKLINNPVIKIMVPYNGADVEQIANIRVLNTISDTSEISERLFPGQFVKWTIQLEIQDAFLYDVPYRKNWKLYVSDSEFFSPEECSAFGDILVTEDHEFIDKAICSTFEVGEELLARDAEKDEIEYLKINFKKE